MHIMYQLFYIHIDGIKMIIYLLLTFSSLKFSSLDKYKKESRDIRKKLSHNF